MSDAFSERLRLIRFRRKRERAKFTQELKIIPKWLVWTCAVLYIVALVIGVAVNLHNLRTGDAIFPDETFRNQPELSCVALGAVITAGAIFVSIFLLMLGYIYRDAKRRDMNPALWTLLVLILSPAYLFIGLIIYLLVREPLPYSCPQCAATVSARFNFCPNCKYNLHPTCPQCQREVSDDDKFCPFCATELSHSPKSSTGDVSTSQP